MTTALPVGAYDELSLVSVSSPQTACWASSANSATCHGWTPTTLETQPVEPQADAMSRTAV